MCLASEAGKMNTVASQPEDSSSLASLKTTMKEERSDTELHPPSTPTSSLFPPPPPVTSTSSDAIPPQTSSHSARVKKKSKKKEMADWTSDEKSDHSEPCADSVNSTIEAVATGTWMPKKKMHTSTPAGSSGAPKKKSKNKQTNSIIKEKDEIDGENNSSATEVKEEMTDSNPRTEAEVADVEPIDVHGSTPETPPSHRSQSPVKLKDEDKEKERAGDIENRGSRKSERSCKGALYKTLVSEGMLTSLRANIDRGISPVRFSSKIFGC